VAVPEVVPPTLIESARGAVAGLVASEPPPADKRGAHHYWPQARPPHPLLAPLLDSPGFAAAESLIRPGKLEVPGQVQVALNISPFSHSGCPAHQLLHGQAQPVRPDGARQVDASLLSKLPRR
jgi:hypothetical protein